MSRGTKALQARTEALASEGGRAVRGMPLERLVAFVSPALAIGALGLPLTLFLPVYFTSYVGLSLSVVGFAFLLVRLLDIGFDPVMGWILDRTRTRWGQCKPWMLVGAALIVTAVLILFFAPPGTTATTLFVGLLILYTGTSIVGVAHPAWTARLAPDYNERSRVYAWMYGAGAAGTFIILALPIVGGLLGWGGAIGSGKPGDDVHFMGTMLSAAIPVALAWAVWRVPEPRVPPAHLGSSGKVRLIDYVMLMKRPTVLRLVLADLFVSLGPAISTTVFIFFWKTARGYDAIETNLIVLTFLAGGLVSIPAWMRIAQKIGKHKAFLISGLSFSVLQPIIGILPGDRLDMLAPAVFCLGMTMNAGNFLIRAMVADAADEARLETGVDHLGQIYALVVSTGKVGAAVAVGVAFNFLQAIGFKATLGTANEPSALRVLEWMYIGVPVFLTLFALLPFIGYRLDRDAHRNVQDALAKRDAEASSLVS